MIVHCLTIELWRYTMTNQKDNAVSSEIDQKIIKLMLLRQTINEINAFRSQGNHQQPKSSTGLQSLDC